MRKIMALSVVILAAAVASIASGYGSHEEPANGQAAAADADDFSSAQWSTIETLSPLPAPPVDTTNKYSDSRTAAALGHRLFFDKRIAGPIQEGTPAEGQLGPIGATEKIACSDCHQAASKWLFDIRSDNGGPIPNATALGSEWMTRNVSSLVNTVFYVQAPGGRDAPHWRENDGFSDSEWFDAQSEPEGSSVQNGSRLQIAHLIFDHYKADYEAAFPEWPLDPGLANMTRFPPTGLPGQPSFDNMAPGDKEIVNRILANYGKAMEAYLRTLVSRDAPFDRFVAGHEHAINEKAKRGLKLFIGKAGCVECHSGPLFSDDDFHTIGLHIDTRRSPYADPSETGRSANQAFICGSKFNVNGPYSDDRNTGRLSGFCNATIPEGQWRTKGLRQVAETGPYMRDGQMATLAEVIEFYDRGGDPNGTFIGGPKEIHPLHLTHQEKKDLEEFLKTLTGAPLSPALIADTHRP
jgi:cytochrome c peroxidase